MFILNTIDYSINSLKGFVEYTQFHPSLVIEYDATMGIKGPLQYLFVYRITNKFNMHFCMY